MKPPPLTGLLSFSLWDSIFHVGMTSVLCIPGLEVGARFPPCHLPDHQVYSPWCSCLPRHGSPALPCSECQSVFKPYPSLLSPYTHPVHCHGQKQRWINTSMIPLSQPSHHPLWEQQKLLWGVGSGRQRTWPVGDGWTMYEPTVQVSGTLFHRTLPTKHKFKDENSKHSKTVTT